MAGSARMPRFIYGPPPILGYLSQNGVLDTADKALPVVLRTESAFANSGNRNRNRERSARSATIDAHTIWEEALAQCDIGRPDGPFALTAPGRFVGDPLAPINIAFRPPLLSTMGMRET